MTSIPASTASGAIGTVGSAAMEARAPRTRRTVTPIRPSHIQAAGADRQANKRIVLRLWLPLTPLFLLLAPFALLLAPFGYLAPRPYGERPFATVLRLGALLLSLGGTFVEIDTREALIRIRIV